VGALNATGPVPFWFGSTRGCEALSNLPPPTGHAEVKYLLDSNVWLDAITNGPHAHETIEMLQRASPGSFATTDFSVHTVGLILGPMNPDLFRGFLDDLIRHHVFTLHLAPSELYSVIDRMSAVGLDFDDAFQYLNAERSNLKIVSFDTDFDRTSRGRITPADVLAELSAPPKP
jgi:predicted nucleic acid-binding protein